MAFLRRNIKGSCSALKKNNKDHNKNRFHGLKTKTKTKKEIWEEGEREKGKEVLHKYWGFGQTKQYPAHLQWRINIGLSAEET